LKLYDWTCNATIKDNLSCNDDLIHLIQIQTKPSDFFQVIYLEPGESSEFDARNGSKVGVKATAGPVLGPPWQRPENG
jgi:hypothetical protein